MGRKGVALGVMDSLGDNDQVRINLELELSGADLKKIFERFPHLKSEGEPIQKEGLIHIIRGNLLPRPKNFTPPETPPGEIPTDVDLRLTYERAHHGNDRIAQLNMGLAYLEGSSGVTKDGQIAVYWFERSARERADGPGNVDALGYLGDIYFYNDDTDIPSSDELAYYYYMKGAEQKDTHCLRALGDMYYQGSVPGKDNSDHTRTIQYYEAAALQGDAWALYFMGHVFHDGELAEKDWVEAYKWYWLANEAGQTDAVDEMVEMTQSMAPEDIDEAIVRAKKWLEEELERPLENALDDDDADPLEA